MTLPYTDRWLSLLHVADATKLRPALYASELWQPANSYQLDTSAQRVTFRHPCGQTDVIAASHSLCEPIMLPEPGSTTIPFLAANPADTG